VDLDDLDDAHEQRHDFRRANGAPLVSDPDNPTKSLRYSRPSGYVKCLDDEMALVEWRIWKAMTGVASSPALAAEVSSTKDEDRDAKKGLREKALDKGKANETADMGKALHAMTARAEDVNDIAFDPPEQYVPDLTAYIDALATFGLVSEMIEVPLVSDAFRAAGTADRIYRLTKPLIAPDGSIIDIGELIVGDLKTGKMDFALPSWCAQMALYADGVLYDIIAERRLPTPPINHTWTIVVHLPVGAATCDLYWCNIELGLKGAMLAQQVREWRKLWKNGTYDAPKIEVPKEPTELIIEELGAEVIGEASLVEMSMWCQQRINAIGQMPDAKKWLIMKWPDGLPTPKKGIENEGQLLRLMSLLDAVETQFSMPFGPPDPRLKNEVGTHKSKIKRDDNQLVP
jgi:hypothetical protein